ncbi:hypothetical protein T492DRAFT_370202 [Pavlovales sp. CCMP2436]|nr:hypothetical protein T492DRAFT_370202 [Pavlovales sp. CCMP2436]
MSVFISSSVIIIIIITFCFSRITPLSPTPQGLWMAALFSAASASVSTAHFSTFPPPLISFIIAITIIIIIIIIINIISIIIYISNSPPLKAGGWPPSHRRLCLFAEC